MGSMPPAPLPIENAVLANTTTDDAAELLDLQRCCWVEEATANETLDIAALHESFDDARAGLDEWGCRPVRGQVDV